MILVLLAAAPAIAIALAVVLRDRYEPEPRPRLLAAFLAGAASVLLLAGFRILVGSGEPLLSAPEASTRLIAWIVFVGALEELAKLIAVSPFVMSRQANEPVDFVVYSVLVALGFATVENIAYVLGGNVAVGMGRAILSVPAHAVFGAIMGAMLYQARARPSFNAGLTALAALVPGVVHGVWNFLLSQPGGGQLLLVPFHLGLVAFALYVLESTALASPFRFAPAAWDRDPVRRNPDVDAERLKIQLRLAGIGLWVYQLGGALVPLGVIAFWTRSELWPLWLGALVIGGMTLLIQLGDRRKGALVDLRTLVPAEAGGLTPEDLEQLHGEAIRALRLSSSTVVQVRPDRQERSGLRQRLCAPLVRDEAFSIPGAAFRLLDRIELRALICQRLALRQRLAGLPLWTWSAPLLATWAVVFVALESHPLVTYTALFLWPAIVLPFRLVESRLIETVRLLATHLSDLDAARAFGLEPVTNAILKLATRDDRLLLVEEHATELARAGALDTATLTTAAAGTGEPTAIDGTALGRIATRAGRAAAAAISGASQLTDRPGPIERIDWRDYDGAFRDGRLDRDELGTLISRLIAKPELPLFASGAYPEGCNSTPSIRDRLLFIYRNGEPGA